MIDYGSPPAKPPAPQALPACPRTIRFPISSERISGRSERSDEDT